MQQFVTLQRRATVLSLTGHYYCEIRLVSFSFSFFVNFILFFFSVPFSDEIKLYKSRRAFPNRNDCGCLGAEFVSFC